MAYVDGGLLLDNEDLDDIGQPVEVRNHEVITKDLKKRPMPGGK